MSDDFWVGVGIATVFLILVLALVGAGELIKGYRSNLLLTECEETLPRDQNCTLIAVPPAQG